MQRSKKKLVGVSAIAAIAMGLTIFMPTSALAQEGDSKHPILAKELYFADHRGVNWKVPRGIYEIYVTLEGGAGGCYNCKIFDDRERDRAQGGVLNFTVGVTPGDEVKIYAGQQPKENTSISGDGYIKGGRGGEPSSDGKPGSGGGGASALLINDELIAVAGGGGGNGGAGGQQGGTFSKKQIDKGGNGGHNKAYPNTSKHYHQFGFPGEGKNSGTPGYAREYSKLLQVNKKPGGNGEEAGVLTYAGGGGGGGGGYPSGDGGGAGKGRLSYGSGAGGAAGSNWVNANKVTVISEEKGPSANPNSKDTNYVRISFNPKTRISLSSVGEGYRESDDNTPLSVGEDFSLIAGTYNDYDNHLTPGRFELTYDGELITSGLTDGKITIPLNGLKAGEHELVYTHLAYKKIGRMSYPADEKTSQTIKIIVAAAQKDEILTPEPLALNEEVTTLNEEMDEDNLTCSLDPVLEDEFFEEGKSDSIEGILEENKENSNLATADSEMTDLGLEDKGILSEETSEEIPEEESEEGAS